MLFVALVGDCLDLGGRELERRQPVEEALEPFLLGTRGDGHDAKINNPPQRDLALADAVLLGQLRVRVVQRAGLGLGHRRQRSAVVENSLFSTFTRGVQK